MNGAYSVLGRKEKLQNMMVFNTDEERKFVRPGYK
jgi:hypothetical protein